MRAAFILLSSIFFLSCESEQATVELDTQVDQQASEETSSLEADTGSVDYCRRETSDQLAGPQPDGVCPPQKGKKRITVNFSNSAPTAYAGDDQIVFVGDLVTLDGSGSSDPNGDALTYSWSISASPPGSTATIGNTTSATASIQVDAVGDYELALEVSDGTQSDVDAVALFVDPVVPGILLGGDPNSPAKNAVSIYEANVITPDNEIDIDVNGGRSSRTLVEIEFESSATVGEINLLLSGVDARVVGMLPNVPHLEITFPDPGSSVALDALVSQLKGHALVTEVAAGIYAEPDVLPNDFTTPLDGEAQSILDHQLAIRAYAAWNAKSAITASPLLIVVDNFHFGAPEMPAFDVGVLEGSDFTTNVPPECTVSFSTHGYEVLSVAGASFGGTGVERATGVYPSTFVLRAFPCIRGFTAARFYREISNIVRFELKYGRPIILNTSIGMPGCIIADCIPQSKLWVNKLVGDDSNPDPSQDYVIGNITNSFLHVTSAGNWTNFVDAYDNSVFALAADLPGNDAPFQLPNVLVVENRTNSIVDGRPVPGFLSLRSSVSGNISGIGTDISVMTGPDGGVLTPKSGTSYSAPQVAGVAAMIWGIDPNLTVQEVKGLIVDTAVNMNDGRANVIDAYSAVLAMDSIATAPLDRPVRRAILNANIPVSPSDTFNWRDVDQYLHEFHVNRLGVATLDFSRWDLNGDGYTDFGVSDSDNPRPFDLDADNAIGPAPLEQDIEGQTEMYDEAALTDLQILCYYAYSNLYDDTDQENIDVRRNLLQPPCTGAIDTTVTWNGSEAVNDFGDDGHYEVYGQTFVVPEGYSILDSLKFWVAYDFSSDNADFYFVLNIQPWGIDRPSGAIEFAQGVFSLSPAETQLMEFNIDTGVNGLTLIPGQKYVLYFMVNPANWDDTSTAARIAATTNDSYTAGETWRLNTDNNLALLNSTAWSEALSRDIAMVLQFSHAPPN